MQIKTAIPSRHGLPRWAPQWYVALLFLAYAVILLVHPGTPSLTDYSDWTYEGVLLRNHILGVADPAHILKHYPVPNSATTTGIGLLALLLPWQMAAKLWLLVLLLCCFLATRHMMHTLSSGMITCLLAPGAAFLNVNLWYGFVNFQLGLSATVFVASLLLREERRDWLLGLMLGITYFVHMITFAFASLLVCTYAVQRKRWRLLWQLLPGAALSVWYVAARMLMSHNADGEAGMVSRVQSYSAAFWAYKLNSWLKSFGWINLGTLDGSVSMAYFGAYLFVALFLANTYLCAVVGWAWIRSAGEATQNSNAKHSFIWLSAGLVLPFFLLAPGTTLGVSDPGSRLLQVVLAVTIFLVADGSISRSRLVRSAAGAAAVLQLASLFLLVRVGFSPGAQPTRVAWLPPAVVTFAHVPNHVEDYYLEALGRGDMRLHVFPTALFLNTPAATVEHMPASSRTPQAN